MRKGFLFLSILLLSQFSLFQYSFSQSPRSSLKEIARTWLPHHNTSQILCTVCETFTVHIEDQITKTPQQYKVQSRFRVDEKQHKPYARSEFRILEVIEQEVSQIILQYGISNHTERLRLLKKPEGGNYKPEFFEFTPKVHDGIKRIYDEIVDAYLDDLLEIFSKKKEINQIKREVCVGLIRACHKSIDLDAKFDELEIELDPTPVKFNDESTMPNSTHSFENNAGASQNLTDTIDILKEELNPTQPTVPLSSDTESSETEKDKQNNVVSEGLNTYASIITEQTPTHSEL